MLKNFSSLVFVNPGLLPAVNTLKICIIQKLDITKLSNIWDFIDLTCRKVVICLWFGFQQLLSELQ